MPREAAIRTLIAKIQDLSTQPCAWCPAPAVGLAWIWTSHGEADYRACATHGTSPGVIGFRLLTDELARLKLLLANHDSSAPYHSTDCMSRGQVGLPCICGADSTREVITSRSV